VWNVEEVWDKVFVVIIGSESLAEVFIALAKDDIILRHSCEADASKPPSVTAA